MYDFEAINDILNQMANEGMVERMVEPIDESDTHPMDFADVTGLWDEMYPEPLDANDFVW
jgi:Ca2+-binding EF-hand superfamily protein